MRAALLREPQRAPDRGRGGSGEGVPGLTLNRLEALPAWLRWTLFLPVGLAFHFIVAAVLESLFRAAGVPPGRYMSNARIVLGVLQFVSGLTFTLFPSLLAPRPRPVSLVLFALGVLSDVVPIAYSYVNYEYQSSRLPLAAAMAAVEAVGGLVAVLVVWRRTRATAVPGPIRPGAD